MSRATSAAPAQAGLSRGAAAALLRHVAEAGAARRRMSPGWALACVLVLVAAAVPQLTWWRGFGIVWGADGALPLSLSEVHQYFSITPATANAPDARKLPFLYPWGLFLMGWHKLGLPWDPAVAQHVLVFGLLAASGLGALAWSRRLLPRLSLPVATVAALFYMFNPYALITVWSAQSNLMFHYSFLPLLGLAVTRLGERPSWRSGCGVAVVWSLLMTPAYVTTPLLVTDVALVLLLLSRAALLARGGRRLGRIVVAAAALFGTFLLLNAFWIWPLLSYYDTELARGTASANNQSAELFDLNSTPLADALRLNGYWGLTSGVQGSPYFPWAAYYYKSWASLLSYLPMLLAASGLVFYPLSRRLRGITRAERASLLFLAVTVAGLVVAVTGSRPPFGSFNTTVMSSLHLLDVFRSVYARFTEYLPLVIAPLLAAGLDALLGAVRNPETRRGPVRALRAAAAVSCGGALAALLVVVLPWPLWTGALYDATGPLPAQRFDLPESVVAAGRLIDAQEGDFAVAAFPMGASSLTYLRWPSGGFTGIQPYAFLTKKTVILGDVGSPAATRLSSLLSSSPTEACEALTTLNVRAVVLDRSSNSAVTSWRSAAGADVPATQVALARLPCLRLARTGSVVEVYLNEAWTPRRFYAVSSAPGAGGVTDLSYRKVLPGVYRVTLPHNRSATAVVVNTPRDSAWRLQGGQQVTRGDLTTFRLAGTAGPTTVLVWNQVEVVTAMLLAVSLLTTAVVVRRRPLGLVRRGFTRAWHTTVGGRR